MKTIINKPSKFVLKNEKEILFFYDVLSKYESDRNNNLGYDYSKVDNNLKSKITLNHKQSPVEEPTTDNTLVYSGSSKAKELLHHVRNAFAHCNIISDDTKNTFSFYDEHNGTCNMIGSMDKTIFFNLIEEIIKTRKP